jgi:NAD(P)H-nitrite reductase large subunit
MEVSESDVLSAIATKKAANLVDIGRLTSAGTGCGRCRIKLQSLLDTYRINSMTL